MSQENLDLLRRGFEHVESTGEVLRETVHPDFVWDMTTFRDQWSRTYVGVDETNGWLGVAEPSRAGQSMSRRSSTGGTR